MIKLNKKCTNCGELKPICEFNKLFKGKYGVDSICRECRKIYNRIRYQNSKEKLLLHSIQYYKNNKDKFKLKRKLNKDKFALYMKERRNDPIIRLNENISANIRHSLKRNKNGWHWEGLVGYTLEDLKKHLESQFKDGMNWENYGEWHIDHKIPISYFNIISSKSKGFKKCWNLENLQPLWSFVNLKKNNKLFQ